MGDLLFFLVGWWLAGCLATFLTCGWVARAVWLVGKMAGCLWQGWEGGLYFYNFMAAPWDGRRSQSRKPLSFRQKSWKRKKTIQLTIGDGLHSYPSMDVPTICFCRMLVNWPMNIIIIIIIFSSSSSSSLSCFWCPWLTFIWVSRCQGKFTGNCNTISALGQSRKKHPGILKLAQWRKEHLRIRPWRVGLFDFGSGSGRVWPKSAEGMQNEKLS